MRRSRVRSPPGACLLKFCPMLWREILCKKDLKQQFNYAQIIRGCGMAIGQNGSENDEFLQEADQCMNSILRVF